MREYMPMVSIVIPVYNGSNYLKEAIDSALEQTYGNCEVIVVNDGSTDNGATEDIARSYGKRIRYYEKENGGVASAINMGVRNMKGEYFAWLSHDDLFHPDKIEKQIQALIDIGDMNRTVFGNFEFMNMANGRSSMFRIEEHCDSDRIEKGIYPILFGAIHFCTMLVPKRRIQKVGLCDEGLKTTQDIEWIFRILRGKHSVFLKEPLTTVRLHDEQGKHHIREYDKEQGITHISFMESISDDEIQELFGTRSNYFSEMMHFYEKDNNVEAFSYAKKQIDALC